VWLTQRVLLQVLALAMAMAQVESLVG